MTVRDRLALLGKALGNFNQREFRQGSTSVDGVDLTKGYCAGVCLDWTRRVLQSGPNRKETFLNYSTTRQEQTLRRMAKAYDGQGATYVAATRKTQLVPLLTQLLTQPEKKYTFKGGTPTGIPVPYETAELLSEHFVIAPNTFDMDMVIAGVIKKSDIQSWLTAVQQNADPQHKKLAGGGREWGQYAKELDDKFQGKKRKFGNIRVVTSSNDQTYGSEGVWHKEVTDNGLQAGCCTIIGLSAPGATGHAVAVHHVGTAYRFFDPNYGVYEYQMEGLKNALQHLFWTPYGKTDDGLDPLLPVYRRREKSTDPIDTKPWTQMGYTIFTSNV